MASDGARFTRSIIVFAVVQLLLGTFLIAAFCAIAAAIDV